MRVAIVGAGAIGCWIGTRIARGVHDVSAVARGATAAALREHGFRLQTADGMVTAPVRVAENAHDLGVQDLVVVAVKGPSMAEAAASVAALLGPETTVLTAMNGVPWWFFDGIGGPYAGTALESVDPGGRIAATIPPQHIVGCVVHAACSTPEPGLVRHNFGNGLIFGESGGGASKRTAALHRLLTDAGFDATLSGRIQTDIWYKLWGNMTMNPVSALTGATMDRILADPLLEAFALSVMREASTIGAMIGCAIAQSGADRNAITRKLGAVRTSMLQDVEAGRMLEIDALLAAPREIGLRVGVPTPNIDALLGLVRLFARVRGLYPA
jgi:2-dehydropantoate 2-reductase